MPEIGSNRRDIQRRSERRTIMEMMNSAAVGGGCVVMGYADSVDSSPRSRGGESWDEPFPSSAAVAASKLRLMCSYGGRIVPRPTDRSLCYLGGETRIVVVERQATLADLSAKLSRNLLGGCNFTLKYKLPNEDLDSLISVTTDEDLDNMIDEYDRIVASSSASSGSSSSRSSRLRLFLFATKPESAPSSIGSLLDDSKSENWFVDALNGAIGMDGLPRGLSGDSASVNCLLGLEDDSSVKSRSEAVAPQPEHEQLLLPRPDSSGKLTRQDVHSMPDSPMVDSASSFGSTSSAPYLSNLPPIRVRPDDRHMEQRMGVLEDHFTQINISSAAAAPPSQRLSDEGGLKDPHIPFHHFPPVANPISTSSIYPSENPSRKTFSSDEEKPDQVAAIGKPMPSHSQHPPLPLQQKYNPLDSVPQDPIARPVYYPERVSPNISTVNPIPDLKRDVPVSSYIVSSISPGEQQQFRPPSSQMQQFQQQQQQQQQQPQFFQANSNPHYVHHPATGTVLPFSAFYQMPIQQSQQSPLFDHQYPVYYLPVRQNLAPPPPYNMPIATPSLADSTHGNSTATTFSKSIPAKPELPPNLYRMAPPQQTSATPLPTTMSQPQQMQPLIQLTSDQSLTYSGMGYHVLHPHHPSHHPPTTGIPVGTNYGYEFATDPAGNPPVYFTQTASPPGMAPSQYQTVVTSPDAGAVAAATALQSAGINEVKQARAS